MSSFTQTLRDDKDWANSKSGDGTWPSVKTWPDEVIAAALAEVQPETLVINPPSYPGANYQSFGVKTANGLYAYGSFFISDGVWEVKNLNSLSDTSVYGAPSSRAAALRFGAQIKAIRSEG